MANLVARKQMAPFVVGLEHSRRPLVIVAGDIGGTRARVALYESDGKRRLREQTFETSAFKNLESVVEVFFGEKVPRVRAAAFGIAGPVIDGRCVATNFPWAVDVKRIGRKFGWKRVTLVNDLVALAHGSLIAPKSKLRSLTGGALPKKKGANLAILAAGTGLGEAALVWDGSRFVPLATEGGHTDFGATCDAEVALCAWLRKRFGRVSYERILSGSGLGLLYDFVREHEGIAVPDAARDAMADASDRNAEISRQAVAGENPAASRAVDLFVNIYGAEAGNLALKSFALGGVFVAGNIASKLESVFVKGAFMERFVSKPPMNALLSKVPVALVLDPSIGLAGAARIAALS